MKSPKGGPRCQLKLVQYGNNNALATMLRISDHVENFFRQFGYLGKMSVIDFDSYVIGEFSLDHPTAMVMAICLQQEHGDVVSLES